MVEEEEEEEEGEGTATEVEEEAMAEAVKIMINVFSVFEKVGVQRIFGERNLHRS